MCGLREKFDEIVADVPVYGDLARAIEEAGRERRRRNAAIAGIAAGRRTSASARSGAPWDPGFYAQGPSNIWEVWVLDVEGHRVLTVTDYFPGTSAKTIAQLKQMVKSISI